MKKFLAILLCLMMALSLVACGDTEPAVEDDPAAQTESGEPEDTQGDAGEGASLLDTMQIFAAAEGLVGSGWNFAGGYVNGVDLTEEQAKESLAQYGGTMQIIFEDETTVSMVQGGGTLSGVYSEQAGGTGMLDIVFDNNGTDLTYIGCFTQIDDTPVLMLLSDDTGLNAVFFTQINEG